jgi:tetratricopeptide (TPR) repeat protein
MTLRQPRRLFQRPRRRPAWPALFALALGGVLVAMATPRLMAGISIEPYDALLRDLGKGKGAELAQLLEAAKDFEVALGWYANAEDSADLAAIYFVAASQFPADHVLRQDFLRRAVQHDRETLQRAPAQPYAWARLALAVTNLEGDSELARQALVQSLRRAPWQPSLAQLRAGMGLRQWPQLDDETRALVRLQIRLAAEVDPRGLVAVVPTPALWAVVEEALVDRPELLLGLEKYRERR